ncbi:MAG TPA: type II secretion system protein [Candidatus Paceibacterota bacterium]|nr:type II secretion system protein [Candidatus Paceibacterota bacterium]
MNFRSKKKKGFSLVELLVVVSIFLIITAVTLFKQSKFSSDILITNTAYEVALSIREAQVFGVGSKQSDIGTQGYGVYFSEGFDGAHYIMYSETPNSDGTYEFTYEPADPSEKYTDIKGEIRLGREQTILDVCGIPNGGDENDMRCFSTNDLSSLNIGFVKPNLYAILNGDSESFERARIIVASSLGDKCRTVEVNHIGQISVKAIEAGETGC